MTVKIRLCGKCDEVAAVLGVLAECFELASDARRYRNRGGLGVRAYAELRLHPPHHSDPQKVRPR